MTWLAEQSKSLNMQQLGCSQLENSIPALASCSPSCHSPDPHRAQGGAGPRSSTSSQAEGRKEEKWKADCPSRLPLPKHISPSPCRRTPGAGSDGSQRRSGQKIHLPASLARDERSRDTLLATAAQGHTKQVPLAGAADFARRSSDASPTLQLKCQTSDLLHSRVLSLFSSPSLCQHGRAVEIQPPFSGE